MNMHLSTPHGEIKIRPARETDAPAFRELRLEALRLHPEAFASDYAGDEVKPLSHWETRLRTLGEHDMIHFAVYKARLVGMCGIYRRDLPKIRHSATIWGVYVVSDRRGLHIAEGLINACADWGRKHGVTIVKLAVVTTNAPAISCYTRCGFSVYGLEPQVIYTDGVMYDELLMVKYL